MDFNWPDPKDSTVHLSIDIKKSLHAQIVAISKERNVSITTAAEVLLEAAAGVYYYNQGDGPEAKDLPIVPTRNRTRRGPYKVKGDPEPLPIPEPKEEDILTVPKRTRNDYTGVIEMKRSGMTNVEISRKTGLNEKSLWQYFKIGGGKDWQLGLPGKGSEQDFEDQIKPEMPVMITQADKDHEQIVKDYNAQGKSVQDIALFTDLSTSKVRSILFSK